MVNWGDVLFEDKLDGLCQKCGKYTNSGPNRYEDFTYNIGGWLRGIFYCEKCLEKLLGGPLPEPVCPIDAENYNPF